jgi:DNA-binding winged helix-turn-helix (wHTH) protein
MNSGSYSFGAFTLDPENRTLRSGGAKIDVNARYLDALILLVGEAGRLVSKGQFLEDVWRGVPVTDEALTQCIKTLRRHLGDDASAPRFIETVPKHGYRFVAPVEIVAQGLAVEAIEPTIVNPPNRYSLRDFLHVGGAGTLGAGVAGVIGGLFYGSVGAATPPETGPGGMSILFVLLWLTIVAALVGGAGVSFGIAAAGFLRGRGWSIAGGALGGFVVGGTVKLLGLDAFSLLLGRTPGDITGAPEGLLLGGAVGLGAWLAGRLADRSIGWRTALAALAGSAGAIGIILLGGKLMGGSLNLLAQAFPGSRLRLDQLGPAVGNSEFGTIIGLATGAMEGALFGGCIVGAMWLARRQIPPPLG